VGAPRPVSDRPSRILARLQHARWVVIAIYALLVPVAAILATRIPHQGAIDRLIVPGDPDYAATRAFQRIFPESPMVVIVFEAADPWAPDALARIQRAEAALARVPHVTPFSVVDVLRRARPTASPDELRALAAGTPFFRGQGLVGDHFMSVPVALSTHDDASRDAALAGMERALANIGPYHAVGAPLVNRWLEHASSGATARSFAIFGVLLLVVTWFLYRSVRALAAIVLALGATVSIALATGQLLGFSFTIVSALVPLTVMVTTLATLTYLHSRFLDQPPGMPLAEHQVAALRNKLLPVTASTIAAAMGFAALVVSNIRPVREMGVWTAIGLVESWLICYTLFPALQVVLRTPTGQRVAARTRVYNRISRLLPGFTYRHRYVLVATALAACCAGAIALRGATVRVDALANIDPSSRLYGDLVWFRDHVMDLNVVRVWIHLPTPSATDPDVLRAVDKLTSELERAPEVTGIAGPTTPLRMRSYIAGQGEALPADLGDVEALLLAQPDLRTFIDPNGLSDLQLTVLFHPGGVAGYQAVSRRITDAWHRVNGPALKGAEVRVVGESLLETKVGIGLVPTLTHSLAITVVLILVVFVVVFRSGIERLLAMIPSLFALLVTFLGMRLLGGSLNIATILIATTVLGTTENDQIHFFHHMHERRGAPLDERLRHAFAVSGRAVAFATLINAVGFLGLAATRFPPLRQFGVMTASAFVLALIADFTVLPAALWLFDRRLARRLTRPRR
jgi:predicted RND superfamily exporter protein